MTLTYKNGNLSGGGSDPPWATGLRWSIAAKFTSTAFTGKVSIVLPAGGTAVSDISLTRR